MPVYEFYCKDHGTFERIVPVGTEKFVCPKCKRVIPKVDSLPARRNPDHGIQR